MSTVYVGLSGGVDSSVAAALLQRDGHRVVGVYMKNWTRDIDGTECPWKTDLADARAVAARLDIHFRIFDFENDYRDRVAMSMVAEYQAGRTPNPDVMCNQEIKFKLFLEAALADGAEMIATGHYARTTSGRLLAAADTDKDQTYFLYRVTTTALNKTIFPLGELKKPEVRRLAAELKLPTAGKPDSQGICFVGEVGIKAFLSQYIETMPGSVVLRRTGERLGEHDGAIYYTIGQRQGLGIGGGKPYYVVGKDMATNTVFVTDRPADLGLTSDAFHLRDVHWIGPPPDFKRPLRVRTRYRAELIDAQIGIEAGPDGVSPGLKVKLARPERAISPGQSAVIYDGDQILGGGIIF